MPPDANSLLCVADHCLKSTNYINVIVSDKQKHLQYMTMDQAIVHCTKGLGIWPQVSNDEGTEPDVVIASAGDIPTKESLAAIILLREHFPNLKIRFINVVDLFRLTPSSEHPHGLSDRDFDTLFTEDKPIIFNFHGYPWLIHRLTYRRTNHKNLHVRGYKEKGNINTPLDLAIRNQIDRFTIAMDVIDRVPALRVSVREFRSFFSIFLQKIKSQRVLSTRSQNPSLPPSLNPPAQRSSLQVPSMKICPSSQTATGSSKLLPRISKSKLRCSLASSPISLRTRSSPPTPPVCPYRKSPQHCRFRSGKDFSARTSSIPRAICASLK